MPENEKPIENYGDGNNTNCIWNIWNIPKSLFNWLEKLEFEGRVDSIQITEFLRSARILKRVMETRGDCPHWDSSEIPSTNAGVKNSNGSITIIIYNTRANW